MTATLPLAGTSAPPRVCAHCGRSEEQGAEFGLYLSNGKPFRRKHCAACHRARERRRTALRRGTVPPEEAPPALAVSPVRLVRARLGPCPELYTDPAGARAYYATVARACLAVAAACGDPGVAAGYRAEAALWLALSETEAA